MRLPSIDETKSASNKVSVAARLESQVNSDQNKKKETKKIKHSKSYLKENQK